MKEIRINGNKVLIYDSIEELPIENYERFNQLLMLDAQIGGDISTVDQHIGAMFTFLNKKDYKKLEEQLINFRQNLIFIVENITPKHLAFIPMVYSINGKKVRNLSDENIKRLSLDLSKKGLTRAKLLNLVEDLKKKLRSSLTFGLQSKRKARERKRISRYLKKFKS